MGPRIEHYLREHDIPFRVHHHAPIVTFEDAKATLSFDPGLLVKGLALAMPTGQTAIVALRAVDRAQYKKIADALEVRRDDLRMATEDELAALDMEVGAVAPIPLPNAVVLVDEAVMDLDLVVCGTGRREASLELAAEDFARLPVHAIGDFRKTTS